MRWDTDYAAWGGFPRALSTRIVRTVRGVRSIVMISLNGFVVLRFMGGGGVLVSELRLFFIISTCGLAAMASGSHAEGRQFVPGQVYLCFVSTVSALYPPVRDRTGDLQRVRLMS